VYRDFRQGSPGRGRQVTLGSSTTAIFGDFGGYFFGNDTLKTICTTRRYATHEIRSKMNNLSAYFMKKSVFGLHCCRARTLALARLSCYWTPLLSNFI